MEKAHIIAEIKRTAVANGGKPLGTARFQAATGIRKNDWYGKYWAKWNDALEEAGCPPNSLRGAYDDEWIIEQLIELIRKLGHYPASGEIRLHARQHPRFPSHSVFGRVGRKSELASKIIDYCSTRKGLEDVVAICRSIAVEPGSETADDEPGNESMSGYVYLVKSGKHYKVGRSNSAGRREYELAIQLPERATTVHTITTDDPTGIEEYWHRRFAAKRLNGEWFNLDAADIRAFKRRKFM